MTGALLGYVVTETTRYADGSPDVVAVAMMLSQVQPDRAVAEREAARAQAHADLDADVLPHLTLTYAVAEVRALSGKATP